MKTSTRRLIQALSSGLFTMVVICALGLASYFFGQPSAVEVHWFWMAMISLCIVVLAMILYARAQLSRRRDAQLFAILDAVPHVLFFKDPNLRYRVVNAEFSRLFHVKPGDAIGATDNDIFGPELHERFSSQDREMMKSAVARDFDDPIVIDGELRNIQTRKRPVFDPRGKLRGVVGVAIDLTEELKLQRQVADTRDRLRLALDVARMGIWELNLADDVLWGDERSRQLLGLHEDETGLAASMAHIHPEDREKVARILDNVRSMQGDIDFVFRVVDDSGAVRWVEGFASTRRLHEGGDYLVGVNRDVTERRLSEIALEESKLAAERVASELEKSQADLSLALTIGGLGVWRSVTRLSKRAPSMGNALLGTVIEMDANSHRILGHGAGGAPTTFHDLLQRLHPEDRKRVAVTLGRAYEQGQGTYSDQFRIRRSDGVMRIIDARGSVVTRPGEDADTVNVLFTGIAKDISNEEELKRSLVAKAEEARSAVEAKGQFLAMMSHEVRTPLNGVLGMIDLVLDTPLTEAQRGMLRRSRESSVALLTIINDILDFSKIEAGKLDIENRPLDLRALIDDVCAIFEPEAGRKKITLAHAIDPSLPHYLLGDSVRLRQVLTNLIGNAVKFTDRGGIEVRAGPGGDGAQLLLTVQDSGIGIDPAIAESLFKPFQQAELATTRRYGGTGLGLTIVRKLAELMHGDVRCESAVGEGSRFIVRLPLRAWVSGAGTSNDAAARKGPGDRGAFDGASAAPPANAIEPIGRGRTVLLAEDHQINREVVTMQLTKLGFACDWSEDGEGAWEKLLHPDAAYALLLTDCHMPRLDGYELTRRLRAREAELGLARLPIVAITANALPDEADRCLALGMDGYLSKPLLLHDLRRALADVLDRAPAPADAKPEADARTPGTPAPEANDYRALGELCGGDRSQVAQLLDIFVKTTESDLKAMDEAAAAGSELRLRQLAHRLSSAFHQIDEKKIGAALRAMQHQEDAQGVDALPGLRASHLALRPDMDAALDRARAFIARNAATA